MKKMTVRNIREANACKRKGFFDSLGLVDKKGKNYYLAIAAKDAIKENNKSISFLDSKLPKGLFILEETKNQSLLLLSKKIDRYLSYLSNKEIIARGRVVDLEMSGVKIPITIDLVIDNGEYLEVVIIKTGKTNLSYRARISSNMPENNVELYLLQKAGEMLPQSILKNREVVATTHYLTAKDEKQSDLYETFNSKKGSNIISCNRFSDELKEDIDELLKEELNSFVATENPGCDYCPHKSACNLDTRHEIELEEVEEMQDKAGKGFSITKSQEEAIKFSKGIARINAGAGSGKTTVISLRVIDLLEQGYKPEDILLITFTNKGAQEMRDKIAFWLDKKEMEVNQDLFNIMTFNAWGAELLDKNYELLGYTNAPQIADRVAVYDIIISMIDDYTEKISSYDYRNPLFRSRGVSGVVVALEDAFNYIKGHNLKSVEEFRSSKYDKVTGYKKGQKYKNEFGESIVYLGEDDYDRIFELYEEYIVRLKDSNLIEYQDQVNNALELISDHDYALKNLSYKHLIIDEMQDSDQQQLKIMKYLTEKESFESLIVVGDDLQSIFGFRNTSQEIILNFHNYFPGVVDINITENFRSTKAILDLANAISNLNEFKLDKELVSKGTEGSEPIVISFDDKSIEIPKIAQMIKEDYDRGEALEEIAFISRTKADLSKLHEQLKVLGVPSIIDVPESFINNLNLHIAQSLSEYFTDMSLSSNLFNYIYTAEKEFIKDLSKEELVEYIKSRMIEIEGYIYQEGFSPIDEAGNLTVDTNREFNERKLTLFFDMLSILEDKDLEKFIEEIQGEFSSMSSLNYYLNKFIVYEDPRSIEKDDKKYKAVTLTTAHSAKGREWDKTYVSVSRFNDPKEQEALEEERRLVFGAKCSA